MERGQRNNSFLVQRNDFVFPAEKGRHGQGWGGEKMLAEAIKLVAEETQEDSQALCRCGCGQRTAIVTRTISLEKVKKGDYRQFVKGHHNRILKQGYKNGTFIHHGYIYVLKPEHPYPTQNQYVKRSRLVMEESLGRYLESHEQVHHKNKIRNDDRIENLELTSLSQHNRIHQKTKLMMEKRYVGRNN